VSKKVSRVDIAVFCEEIPVATATEHQFWVQLSAQFGPAFCQNSWEIGDASQVLAE
jgi:hypothetical protein